MNQAYNVPVSALAHSYFKQLDEGGFSAKEIEDELRGKTVFVCTNKELVLESILNSHLI